MSVQGKALHGLVWHGLVRLGKEAITSLLKGASRMNNKSIEQRLRRHLYRQGYQLRKSRAKNWSLDNQLGYMIVDPYYNIAVAGARFDLSLEEAMDFAELS